jgi:hypothetical protein
MLFGNKKRERAAARDELRSRAEAAGWRWRDAAEAPAIEIREAAFRRARQTGPIWTTGMADVIEGETAGRPFVAARLVGYAYSTTNSGTPGGDRVTTNAVWMPLPAMLPEIRFVDSDRAATRDYGLQLPPLPSLVPLSPRWSVEGFSPAFAADVLQPPFVSALEAAPAGSTIVIRAGRILAYGDPVADVESIAARAGLLAALIEAVPAACWGRADALVGGTGVFPFDLPDGAGLHPTQRLVAPDWTGHGLAKVPWQEAPAAPRSVALRHRESVDVFDIAPGQGSPLAVGLSAAGAPLVHPGSGSGIPTVASTLAAGDAGSPQP